VAAQRKTGRGRREPRRSQPGRLYAIARNLVEDPRFPELKTSEQALLLVAFLRVGDSAGRFWVSFETFAKWLGCSRATAKRAMNGLMAAGLVEQTRWYRREGRATLEGTPLYMLDKRLLRWRGEDESEVVREVADDPPYARRVTGDTPVRKVTDDPPIRSVAHDPPDRSLPVHTRAHSVAPGAADAAQRAEAPVSAWSDAGCSRCGKGAGEEVEYLTLQAAGRTARLCPECFERAAAALRAAWETDA